MAAARYPTPANRFGAGANSLQPLLAALGSWARGDAPAPAAAAGLLDDPPGAVRRPLRTRCVPAASPSTPTAAMGASRRGSFRWLVSSSHVFLARHVPNFVARKRHATLTAATAVASLSSLEIRHPWRQTVGQTGGGSSLRTCHFVCQMKGRSCRSCRARACRLSERRVARIALPLGCARGLCPPVRPPRLRCSLLGCPRMGCSRTSCPLFGVCLE